MKFTRGLTVCLITLNEEYWLPRTLPGMVENSDRLIVIDGDTDGPSTDRTVEIVMDMKRPQDVLVRGGVGRAGMKDNWDLVKRNAYLPMIETSHMLLVDGDEAYLPQHWKKIHQYVGCDVNCVLYGHVHLWMDTCHQITGGFFDAPCHHFTRYDPSFSYRDISTVLRRSDGKAVAEDHILDNEILLFDYNRMSPPGEYKKRQRKFLPRWDGGSLTPAQILAWDRDWKDDRRLDHPDVIPYDGPHPLEGML